MDMKKTYWYGNGLYNNEYDEIWKKFIPSKGFTENKYINALIISSKLYYDVYNNGLGNEDIILPIFKEKISEIENELSISFSVLEKIMESKKEIHTWEEPVYCIDEEGYETDEIDYYTDESEEEYIITEEDRENYELLMDNVIELAYSRGM